MDEEVRQRDNQYKQELKSYHDTRHRAKEHKFKVGDAVLLKRVKKLKGETPFEPYVYIATKVIGSTIHAKRVNDQKTECGDASKFKLLRTACFPTQDKQREARPARPVVSPTATSQEIQPVATEDTLSYRQQLWSHPAFRPYHYTDLSDRPNPHLMDIKRTMPNDYKH